MPKHQRGTKVLLFRETIADFYMLCNMFFIIFSTFFAQNLVVSKLFTNFAGDL